MIETDRLWLRSVVGVGLGLVIFFASAKIIRSLDISGVVARQVALKGSLIIVSIVIWGLLRRNWAQMGWKCPKPGVKKLRWYIIGAVAMGAASVVMILTESKHPLVAEMSFPQIILTVWLLSSVSEEIFVRGLVQSWITDEFVLLPGTPDAGIVVLASPLLFAAMHIPLLWSGAGAIGGGTIVAATFVLGWAAAEIRLRTDSLLHAIGVHIVGNIAAVPFGIIGVLVYRLIHGHVPVR